MYYCSYFLQNGVARVRVCSYNKYARRALQNMGHTMGRLLFLVPCVGDRDRGCGSGLCTYLLRSVLST